MPANPFVKLDPWVSAILVDPISKSPLRQQAEAFLSDYGKRYGFENGIPDLRPFGVHRSAALGLWKHGQAEYENWSDRLVRTESCETYALERDVVREVYAELPLKGRCLDVAGHQGRLRAYLDPHQQYVSIDAYASVFDDLASQTSLLQAFPELREPVNFVCAMAEHLPFASNQFDTVHMRSCVDHFYNPELAMLEAFRVLRPGGQLIVGIFVEGGKTGTVGFRDRLKHGIRDVASAVLPSLSDHHLWHPTYPALCELIATSGFSIDKTHWQRGYEDQVCYVRALKSDTPAGAG